MIDERDLFERTIQRWSPPEPSFERLLRRRDRRRRNRRIGSAVVALLVTAGVAVGLTGSFRSGRPAPAVSPPTLGLQRNERIAFVSPGQGQGRDRLYTTDAGGTGVGRITSGNAEYPDWSPDGLAVAFDDGRVIATRDWSAAAGHIFTVSADGTGLTQVTNGPGAEFSPAWAPDGAHLAVSAEGQPGLPAGIFIVDVAGGGMHPVTANPFPGYVDKEPDYSPDGTRIVFVRDRQLVDAGDPANLSALFVVNVDGTGLRRLTEWVDDAGSSGTPAWSPDGSVILFAGGDIDPPPGGRLAQIYVIGADGTGLRRITSSATLSSFWPSWSPDGARIVFTRRQPGGRFRLLTMVSDGSHLAPLGLTGNEAAWGVRR